MNTEDKRVVAKQFIESRYTRVNKLKEDREARKQTLQAKMNELGIDENNQHLALERHQENESRHLRATRGKMSVEDFEQLTIIGRGAFGEVRLVREHGSQNIYAMKKLRKAEMVLKGQVHHVRAELDVMSEADDTNEWVVKLHYSFQDDEYLYLVMEYVPGGDVMSLLMKRDILTEQETRFYMAETVLAIESLHNLNYIHRDIKPDNLLLTAPGRLYKGSPAMLKIADFGTSCLCEGDANAQKTAGTPAFFSPELCSVDTDRDSYDIRVVDLWAVGVTLFLWSCGRCPFVADTIPMVIHAISKAPETTTAPLEASPGLAAIICGLLTRDPAARLTLSQLRLHEWLTDGNKQALPPQPIMKITVSAEDIEQAFSNRKAVAVGSASGPSALGATLSLIRDKSSIKGATGGWTREGESTICKRTTEAEASIWRQLGASGDLAHHIPVVYSIGRAEGEDAETHEAYDIKMQDLASGMVRPCAMAVIMGSRTITPEDFTPDASEPRPDLLTAMDNIDPGARTAEDETQGISQRRFLGFLDEISSTSSLGFRIDAGKTVVNKALEALPLPKRLTLAKLKEEADVLSALAAFMQRDRELAAAFLLKLESLSAALERSSFFSKHVFLRTTMLFVYDDAARTKLELKIMNFGASYALPEGERIDHLAPWDGTQSCHQDGYLMGLQSLIRVMKMRAEPSLAETSWQLDDIRESAMERVTGTTPVTGV